MKKILIIAILLFLCLIAKSVMAEADLDEGDDLFDKSEFFEAARIYEEIIMEDPDDYDVLWRMARCYTKCGWVSEAKKKQKEYLEMAVDHARQAIKVEPDSFEGHLYLAEPMGILSRHKGSRWKVRASREIKKEVEIAMSLEPDHYKPYLILGMWHRKIKTAGWLEKELAKVFFGGLPETSLEEAERNIKKSIKLRPNLPKSHYELALVYKAMKKKILARKSLKNAMNCPILTPKDKEVTKDAMKLFRSLKLSKAEKREEL